MDLMPFVLADVATIDAETRYRFEAPPWRSKPAGSPAPCSSSRRQRARRGRRKKSAARRGEVKFFFCALSLERALSRLSLESGRSVAFRPVVSLASGVGRLIGCDIHALATDPT